MNTILITGGAGFIGSNLTEKLISLGKYRIVVVDNLITGKKKNLPNKLKYFYNCDVNNYNEIAKIFKLHNISYVFHFAAVVGVKRTQENPLKVLNDIEGFKNIFNLCSNYKIKKIFFSSSSEVYGEPVTIPQNEDTTPLNSRIPYAIVKNVGESFCKTFLKEKNLKYTIFRFFNTYGKKQTEDFVISKFIKQAKKNNNITIYGNGFQKRTFCFIDDSIDATIKCFQKNLFVNQVVNIGNDNEISMLKLAKIIKKILTSKSKIVHLKPLKEGDMLRRKPDISKMKKLLKRDFINLEKGIKTIT